MAAMGIPISIHALREEGDTRRIQWPAELYEISIHALREEGDRLLYGGGRCNRPISIHALREEGDSQLIAHALIAKQFLSTPSARRATAQGKTPSGRIVNFYPRPPRGGRQH